MPPKDLPPSLRERLLFGSSAASIGTVIADGGGGRAAVRGQYVGAGALQRAVDGRLPGHLCPSETGGYCTH